MSNLGESGLVSVIIPTHNRALMLEKALISVLNQSYNYLEIIIVADNCIDNSEDIINKFKDPRIRFISLKQNVGGAQARNIGIDNANGEFIAFLDDDDRWLPDKTKQQVEFMESHPHISIVSCNYTVKKVKSTKEFITLQNYIILDDLLMRNVLGSFSFCMLRKGELGELRINRQLRSAQDWDLWVKILMGKDSRAFIIPDILVEYNDSHNNRLTKNYANAINSYKLFILSKWDVLSPTQRYYHLSKYYLKKNYVTKTKFCISIKYIFYTFGFARKAKRKLSIKEVLICIVSLFYSKPSD